MDQISSGLRLRVNRLRDKPCPAFKLIHGSAQAAGQISCWFSWPNILQGGGRRWVQGSSPAPLSPVPGPTAVMRHREYQHLARRHPIDQRVRKSPRYRATNTRLDLSPRARPLADETSDSRHFGQKAHVEVIVVVLGRILVRSLVGFFLRFGQQPDVHAQPADARRSRGRRGFAASLRFASSNGTGIVSPRSTAASRRFASTIQAASISSGEDPSPMLSARIAASSARSASGNFMAASRMRLASSALGSSLMVDSVTPAPTATKCMQAAGAMSAVILVRQPPSV
jgi:hypothetical protein